MRQNCSRGQLAGSMLSPPKKEFEEQWVPYNGE
ncbi:hypothetical protein ES319_A04G175300v1 [Gossypium barbadense]|uniref:Uncharacterized protein n=1 Tax=Gossypium barbadense TaxID=3634 RepID=A0A5J5W8N4_GOSBA|nr:hypothetical protein ES319_A04G175300v1 [Gossypium barbadense]